MTAVQWVVATAIAALAALIAYFQWRTAHQRVVLDLFDRHDVYKQLRTGIGAIVTSGKVSAATDNQILQAIETAKFYFGDDVISYLDRLYDAVIDLGGYSSEINGAQGKERVALIKKRRVAFDRVEAFYKDAPKLFAPYMRLDQKMPSLWGLRR